MRWRNRTPSGDAGCLRRNAAAASRASGIPAEIGEREGALRFALFGQDALRIMAGVRVEQRERESRLAGAPGAHAVMDQACFVGDRGFRSKGSGIRARGGGRVAVIARAGGGSPGGGVGRFRSRRPCRSSRGPYFWGERGAAIGGSVGAAIGGSVGTAADAAWLGAA